MNINWYPGHMLKAQNDLKSSLNLIDIVVEVLDARIPKSSMNPNIDKFAVNKQRIIVLNKCDLADKEETLRWKKYFELEGKSVIILNATNLDSIKSLVECIKMLGKKVYDEKNVNKKININNIYRAVIVGIPNVGKSTIINKISGKKSANVGNKPGVTKKKQWIRVDENIDLLDTPGLLWPKFESEQVGINLALTGNIKQDILDVEELAANGIKLLYDNLKYRKLLYDKYKLNENDFEDVLSDDEYIIPKEYQILNMIGKKRGCVISGGDIDLNKASKIFLEELKNGKIGGITLESI